MPKTSSSSTPWVEIITLGFTLSLVMFIGVAAWNVDDESLEQYLRSRPERCWKCHKQGHTRENCVVDEIEKAERDMRYSRSRLLRSSRRRSIRIRSRSSSISSISSISSLDSDSEQEMNRELLIMALQEQKNQKRQLSKMQDSLSSLSAQVSALQVSSRRHQAPGSFGVSAGSLSVGGGAAHIWEID